MKLMRVCGTLGFALLPMLATADTARARCEVYALGQDHTENVGACTFSQRQGFVTIRLADGVVHELRPVGDRPGNFEDARGRAVYRQSGLGRDGQVFRFPEQSVYVYWQSLADADSPTEPYSASDFDATALLTCRADGHKEETRCPAGILRMEGGASIVVLAPGGQELTINFLPDYVNTGFGPAEAQLEGDLWTVRVPGAGVFEVPLAAIEGG